ncbi:chorismate-binding protein [Yeosuana marina]|uniref:chorismate-binding protein n=1 Tax=Yeosuana marina TaxID=1565536 RepID=UPI0030C84AA0
MTTSDQFFETIQKHYNQQLPFVAYRKPNASTVKALLQTDNTLHYVEDYKTSGFVFAPFDDSQNSVLIPLENSESIEINNYTRTNKTAVRNDGFSVANKEKQQHINLVEKGVKAIEKGAFHKVVLSRQETVKLSEFNLFQTFEKLLVNYPSAFVYCWYHPKIGLWLGATPETLMKIEGNHFSMMALAGTQEYSGHMDVDWKDKERAEQQIVTDFIIENLKPFVENLKISDVETVKAGNLLHLRTMISANLKLEHFNLKDLISRLHPTPAVCGLPKMAAKEFILEQEQYSREFYSGYLGELNYDSILKPRSSKRNIENRAYAITKKSTQLYVNLRCMQIKDQSALIYVGGGITKASNPESELEETIKKAQTMKSVLK